MTAKTVAIDEDVHLLLSKKQVELREKYGIDKKISEITNDAIKTGIKSGIYSREIEFMKTEQAPPQEILQRIEYFEEQKKELENEKIIAILDEEISKIKKLWNIVDTTEIKQNKEAK